MRFLREEGADSAIPLHLDRHRKSLGLRPFNEKGKNGQKFA
jgi:hypothetical protein